MAIRNKRIVVKGDPGSGKATLTRYIAYSSSSQTDKHSIPLLIDLKDWAGKGAIPLYEYYAKYVLKGTGYEKTIEPLIEDGLKSNRCIILCDGLDEVTQKIRSPSSSPYRTLEVVSIGTVIFWSQPELLVIIMNSPAGSIMK